MFDRFIFKNRFLLLILLAGFIFFGFGVFYVKNGGGANSDKVEILNANVAGESIGGEIVVEISGEVEKPGVYKLSPGSRIEDLLIAAGGLSAGADRDWVAKTINRAARLSDGQKVFISSKTNNFSDGGGQVVSTLININTADAKALDSLPEIGPTRAQNIIEHRPYSTPQELVSKGVISQSVYEKIKDKITTY